MIYVYDSLYDVFPNLSFSRISMNSIKILGILLWNWHEPWL